MFHTILVGTDGSATARAAEEAAAAPVSYTHLRAHETNANIVCRLLLEKKNKPLDYVEYSLHILNTQTKSITTIIHSI